MMKQEISKSATSNTETHVEARRQYFDFEKARRKAYIHETAGQEILAETYMALYDYARNTPQPWNTDQYNSWFKHFEELENSTTLSAKESKQIISELLAKDFQPFQDYTQAELEAWLASFGTKP